MTQTRAFLAATGVAALVAIGASQMPWSERASAASQPVSAVSANAAVPGPTAWTNPPVRRIAIVATPVAVEPAAQVAVEAPAAPKAAASVEAPAKAAPVRKVARLKARTRVAAKTARPAAAQASPEPVLMASAEIPQTRGESVKPGGPVGDILRGLGFAD